MPLIFQTFIDRIQVSNFNITQDTSKSGRLRKTGPAAVACPVFYSKKFLSMIYSNLSESQSLVEDQFYYLLEISLTISVNASLIGVNFRPRSFSKSVLSTSSSPSRIPFCMATRKGTTKSGTPALNIVLV